LAQQNPSLNVIGLGAQDSLDYANEFVASTGTGGGAITMVWDPSFDSWRQLGIRSQPYWILYDAQGNEVTSRPGAIDIGAVQATLSS
jgi:thioredoxin-related protein